MKQILKIILKLLFHLKKINGDNMQSKTNHLVKIWGNRIESLKGKYLYHKLIFLFFHFLKKFGQKKTFYYFKRETFGPYCEELAFDLQYLKNRRFVEITGDNTIKVDKGRIKYYFNRKGMSLRLSSTEGKAIIKAEELISTEFRDDDRIELATSLLLIVYQGFTLKEEIFAELKHWKLEVFDAFDVEQMWEYLYRNGILPKIVIDVNKLIKMNSGANNSRNYHRLISKIIVYIFKHSFINMKFEKSLYYGRKFIDTVYTNSAEKGFFKHLPEKHKQVNCQYIVLEAKNYTMDVKNREIDQLAGRLNEKLGNFGILVCRHVNNEKLVRQWCQSHLDSNKYIIVLTNKDIIELVEYTRLDLDA